jgi:hypothetical protein
LCGKVPPVNAQIECMRRERAGDQRAMAEFDCLLKANGEAEASAPPGRFAQAQWVVTVEQ